MRGTSSFGGPAMLDIDMEPCGGIIGGGGTDVDVNDGADDGGGGGGGGGISAAAASSVSTGVLHVAPPVATGETDPELSPCVTGVAVEDGGPEAPVEVAAERALEERVK